MIWSTDISQRLFYYVTQRWCCSSVLVQCRWSWPHRVWAVTNTGYWFSSSEVISNSSFHRCLCNCPHCPPQPQLVWLMPLRRKEHMHQRAGARISFESASVEIWNASVCQPVYFACGLCRCIIIYLLQQNSDGTFLFDPFLLVRSLQTCISPSLNPVSEIGHTHTHTHTCARACTKSCQVSALCPKRPGKHADKKSLQCWRDGLWQPAAEIHGLMFKLHLLCWWEGRACMNWNNLDTQRLTREEP